MKALVKVPNNQWDAILAIRTIPALLLAVAVFDGTGMSGDEPTSDSRPQRRHPQLLSTGVDRSR